MQIVRTHLVVGDSLMVAGILSPEYDVIVRDNLSAEYAVDPLTVTVTSRHYIRADKLQEWGSGEPFTVLTAQGELPDG